MAVRNEQLRKEKEKLQWEVQLLNDMHNRKLVRDSAHVSPKDIETRELDKGAPCAGWSERPPRAGSRRHARACTLPPTRTLPLFESGPPSGIAKPHTNASSDSSVSSSLLRATPSLVASSPMESPKVVAARGPPFAPLLRDENETHPKLNLKRRANAQIAFGKFA